MPVAPDNHSSRPRVLYMVASVHCLHIRRTTGCTQRTGF